MHGNCEYSDHRPPNCTSGYERGGREIPCRHETNRPYYAYFEEIKFLAIAFKSFRARATNDFAKWENVWQLHSPLPCIYIYICIFFLPFSFFPLATVILVKPLNFPSIRCSSQFAKRSATSHEVLTRPFRVFLPSPFFLSAFHERKKPIAHRASRVCTARHSIHHTARPEFVEQVFAFPEGQREKWRRN